MIEVICNDRLGRKIRVKCNPDDTIGDLKKLLAAQTGTRPEKLRIQKWYTVYKDHITLDDYEIHDAWGSNFTITRYSPERVGRAACERQHVWSAAPQHDALQFRGSTQYTKHVRIRGRAHMRVGIGFS